MSIQPPTPRSTLDVWRILCIASQDAPQAARLTALEGTGFVWRRVAPDGPLDGVLERFRPEVVVLDTALPPAQLAALVGRLRGNPAQAHLSLLLLGHAAAANASLGALELGADTFIDPDAELPTLGDTLRAWAWRARRIAKAQGPLYQRLHEREQLHRALNQHAIVSIADRTGMITYVNDMFCQISGYRHDELLGNNHRIVKSGLHSEAFYQQLWQTISNGHVWHGEICNRRKDSSLYWVESTITPVLGPQGRPEQYISIRTDISEQVRLAQEAGHSAERLRRSQVFANIGTWDWDIRHGRLYWSERIPPLFGYHDGELETTYENFLRALHPDDREQVVAAIHACIEEGAEYSVEHRVVWPNGQVRWLLEKGDVVRDEKGQPLHMLGVVMDIHERKMAELAQRESESKFRSLFELSPIGIALNTLDGAFLEANQVLLEAIGYRAEELGELSYWQLTPPEYAEQEALQLQQLHATGRYGPYEKEYIHKDGHRFPVLLNGTLVEDREGNLRIWSMVQDISERKAAEQDLRLFRRIFDASEQGISVSDAQGHLLYLNRAHEQLLGYPASEAIGRHLGLFFSTENQGWVNSLLIEATQAGRGWRGRLPLQRKDGGELIASSDIGVITDKDGRPQYLFHLFSDYTGELQWQQQLAQAKEEAERANHAKSEFLSSMSHELRTPLNAILGFSQLLEYDAQLGSEQLDSVHEIIKAGHHLLGLINEVLDLARVESGHIDLSLEPVALGELVEECHALMRPVAEEHQVRLSHTRLDKLLVRADRTRLKQILLNLLSNAIKYNRTDGRVEVSATAIPGARLRLVVSDEGIGIAPAQLSQLFQPFNRLGAEHSGIEGTGIGLAITRRLVQMMDGEIGVESEQGRGSRFWIELPQASQPQPGEPASAHRRLNGATGQRHPAATLLYIEDNPANLKLIRQILGWRPQIRLLTAHTPELGLELAMAHLPQLILLDINLPGMDGYQLLNVLRHTPSLQSTPVIALTASAMPRDIEHGRAAGFADYLTKPLDVTNFLAIVDAFLENIAQ